MSFSVRTEKPRAGQGGQSTFWGAPKAAHTAHGAGSQHRYAALFCIATLASLTGAVVALPTILAMPGSFAMPITVATLLLHAAALMVFTVGRRPRAGALMAAGICTVVSAWAAAYTGGIASPLLALLIIAPLEGLLTRKVRTVKAVFAMSFAGLAAATVLGASIQATGTLSPVQLSLIATGGILYGLTLVARVISASSLKDVRAKATRRAIDQFHAVTHDMFLILKRDGTVEDAFGAVDQIVACGRDGLIGAGFGNRLHVADRPSVMAALDRVYVTQARDSVEARLRVGRDGAAQTFIWAEIDLSGRTAPDGKREIYALVRDVSASKQRAVDLTLAREKAEASDAAKGRFLATMSHELRTPLNAIIGFADILDEEVFGALANANQREYVGLIRESGAHLLQLVNDLLDMSKLEAGHFQIVAEPFALQVVINRCTRLLGQQIERADLVLDVDVPETLPELVADQRAVSQILINLLSNATKFTPKHGKIALSARQDGADMVITVADTGIGIAPKDIKKLGQPFFQANHSYDRAHQGTGLGLSVVKGLCELHEGALSFSSVEGEGTTVTVRLPVSGPSEPAMKTLEQAERDNAVVLAKLEKERDDRPLSASAVKAPRVTAFGTATAARADADTTSSGGAFDQTQARTGRRAYG